MAGWWYLTPAWLASKFRELGLGATFHSPITAIPLSATVRNNFVWNTRFTYQGWVQLGYM